MLKSDPVRAGGPIEYDHIIELNSKHAQKQGTLTLRLVEYNCPESGKHFRFITNNFTLAATTIAAIYKDRWQMDLFFKALKQNLRIKAFLGNSKNAVLTQIWIAMICYLLLTYARHSARKGWSVQRISEHFRSVCSSVYPSVDC